MIKQLFFLLIVHPFVLFFLGLRKKGEVLRQDGPAIIVANHNSHLDTAVIMSLYNISKLPKVRPIAAEDYFLSNALLAWFAKNAMGIIPISRKRSSPDDDPLVPCYEALDNNEIVILFPEGSRGRPEERTVLKKGIAHLAKRYSSIPVIPIYMFGLGKSLPKGEFVPIPFFCDINIGKELYGKDDIDEFMRELNQTFDELEESMNQQSVKRGNE